MAEIAQILIARGKAYGPFISQAHLACAIKDAMIASPRLAAVWAEQLAPDQREALDMIAVKIARILNGDPNYADNWRDIEGYARLVADRLSARDGE